MNPDEYNVSRASDKSKKEDEKFIKKLKTHLTHRKKDKDYLESMYGFPIWNMASVKKQGDDNFMFLPMMHDNEKELSGIIVAFEDREKGDWLYYEFIKEFAKIAPRYDVLKKNKTNKFEYPPREIYAGLFLDFEKVIFGEVDCELLKLVDPDNLSRGCSYYVYSYLDCWQTWVGNDINPFLYLADETCTEIIDYYFICQESTGSSNNSGSSGSSGGTGSGTSGGADGYSATQINAMIALINGNGGFDIDQNPLYKNLNDKEKELVREYPACAITIGLNKVDALAFTKQIFGFNGRNECSDAFRHAFFNALNTRSCGENLAKKFGDAHEFYAQTEFPAESEMDLFNNGVGRMAGIAHPGISYGPIITFICDVLESGGLKVLENPSDRVGSNLISSIGCECNG